ncbi:MAG: hypothetical protein ABL308_06765 [Oceanicaulis sp.]
MSVRLHISSLLAVSALALAACGEAGDDDAARAAREAGDAAQSAGEAMREGWESGDDERDEIAEETAEAMDAVAAQVRSEWVEHRHDRLDALESAGDHVGAAGAALGSGLEAAADAYARAVSDDDDPADFRGREPDLDAFERDVQVNDQPLDGSIEVEGETELEGAGEPIDRDDGDREYVPSFELDIDVHPCAEHDHDTCDHTDAEHARCTPERG